MTFGNGPHGPLLKKVLMTDNQKADMIHSIQIQCYILRDQLEKTPELQRCVDQALNSLDVVYTHLSDE